MVKLRVSVGGSYTDLAIANCNDEEHPLEFEGPEFKGRAVIRIKDFVGITSDGSEPIRNSDYFNGRNRRFSLQVEGRFKKNWTGEQVYFGTDFDRDVELPDGFEMMLRIAKYIDPVVRTSLTHEGKPWILSPMVSSINTMSAWSPREIDYVKTRPRSPQENANTKKEHRQSVGYGSGLWGLLGKLKKNNKEPVPSTSTKQHSRIHEDENGEQSGHDDYSAVNSRNVSASDLLNGGSAADLAVAAVAATQVDDSTTPHQRTKLQKSPSTSSSSSSASSTVSTATSSASDYTDAKESQQATGGATVVVPRARKTSSPEPLSDLDGDFPLGSWRQHVEEDTRFFLGGGESLTTPKRRKHFQKEQARKDFVFSSEKVHAFEFFSPFCDFNTFDVRMGLSLNIRKYLAGQPVRYTCRSLSGDVVFWVVQFELVD